MNRQRDCKIILNRKPCLFRQVEENSFTRVSYFHGNDDEGRRRPCCQCRHGSHECWDAVRVVGAIRDQDEVERVLQVPGKRLIPVERFSTYRGRSGGLGFRDIVLEDLHGFWQVGENKVGPRQPLGKPYANDSATTTQLDDSRSFGLRTDIL